MSIATRTGDDGTTGIMFGHRLSKTDDRIEAYGTVDELNAVIGLARSYREDRWLSEELRRIQKGLIVLMGELAVLDEDRSKYLEKGFPVVDDNMVRHLDGIVTKLEARGVTFRGWDIPGATPMAASLHVARTLCRRAEREVLRLNGAQKNHCLIQYLNRLSDVLWLCAVVVENQSGEVPKLV